MKASQTDEVLLTPALAQSLIARQFPELREVRLDTLGRGMDNAVFRAGEIVFRFPVRRVADEIMATEIAVVPALAPHLPLPVAHAILRGKPAAEYPFHFAGFRYLEGTPFPDAGLSHDEQAALAQPLAAFLKSLHGLNAERLGVAASLPHDTIARLDHGRRYPLTESRLLALRGLVNDEDARAVLEFMRDAAPRDREGERCIVHGDLYAQHLLVDSGHRLAGVIDWGDVHFGNPALDLAAAFYILPADTLAEFFTLYGDADERTIALAAYRAAYHGALVATADWAEPAFLAAGLRAFRSAAAFIRDAA